MIFQFMYKSLPFIICHHLISLGADFFNCKWDNYSIYIIIDYENVICVHGGKFRKIRIYYKVS